MVHLRYPLLILALVSVATCPWPVSAEQRIALHEYLGNSYGPQLLTHAVEFARSTKVLPQNPLLQGSGSALPAQFLEVEHWPNTKFIRTARIAFVADLPAFAKREFVLRAGATAGIATDLQVRQARDAVEITTSKFGIRLFVGSRKFNSPLPSADAPAPVLALRLPNGKWVAGSRLYGNKRVTAASGKLEESGPVLAEWRGRWTYEGGDRLDMRVQFAAGDARALMETKYSGAAPGDGWELLLSGATGWRLPIPSEWGNNRWGKPLTSSDHESQDIVDVDLAAEPEGLITSLVPWEDWWDAMTQTSWTFGLPALGEVLKLERWDAGAWTKPGVPGISVSWGNAYQRSKWVNLVRAKNKDVVIQFSNASGERKWLLGGPGPALGRDLDVVKDYVLDWPVDPKVSYPHLYVSREELLAFRNAGRGDAQRIEDLLAEFARLSIDYGRGGEMALQKALRAYLMTGSRDVAQRGRIAEFVENFPRLALRRKFDFRRSSALLVNLYDAVAGEDLLTSEQMRTFRARMAWLGYFLSDPAVWSPERGYGTGNFAMHVSHVVNLGLVGALLPDHPMAKQWMQSSLAWVQRWLTRNVGPGGEWPENTHYTSVSLSVLLPLLIAANNAGGSDLLRSESLKRAIVTLARQHVPPDPRYSMRRTLVGYAKGTAGERFAIPGLYARAIAKSDPKLSAELQWLWLQTGRSENIADRVMAGFEDLMVDVELPIQLPKWGSVANSTYTILSNGFGTPEEHYTFLLASRDDSISAGERGAIVAMYAYGKPLSLMFGNGEWSPWTREGPLQNRVLAARNWTARDISNTGDAKHLVHDRLEVKESLATFLPSLDYSRFHANIIGAGQANYDVPRNLPAWPVSPTLAKGAVEWTRQMLFVRDDAPAGVNYYLLRDTVSGGQPTEWTMWTMSEKLGTVQEAARRESFLADKPGPNIVPSRALALTDRYTAVGQYGVDLDYFIAAPGDSPRHTLRWGFKQHPWWNGVPEGFGEYQDLLHLRLPGNGAYYLALFPHLQDVAAPAFASLDSGRIIKVSGEFGTDWGFLNAEPAVAEADGVLFQGTAASVQDRHHKVVLALGAAGRVRYRDFALESTRPASLRILESEIVLELEPGDSGQSVKVSAGRPLKIRNPLPGVIAENAGDALQLDIQAGVARVVLEIATDR